MGISLLLFTACSSIGGEVAFEPYGIPLIVSVNTWGEIDFVVDTNIDIPTPLGVASVGVIIDPAKHFDVANTLTVRINGNDHFYDLHGNDFKIEFESGYYEAISLQKRGDSIVLILESDEEISTTYVPLASAIAPTEFFIQDLTIRPTCGDTYILAENQAIRLTYGLWGVKGEKLMRETMNSIVIDLYIDGRKFEGVRNPNIIPMSVVPCGTYLEGSYWFFYEILLDPFERGEYDVRVVYSFLREITDGFDLDNNGELDLFGETSAFDQEYSFIVR